MMRLGLHAYQLHGDVEPGDTSASFRVRGELGVRPDHEVVYLVGKVYPSVDTWEVERAQESTSAESWPAGTPLAFTLSTDEPDGERTVWLAFPLAADASEIDLHLCYRRMQIGSEILHSVQLLGEPGRYPLERLGIVRGAEGTTEAAHAARATVTWLGPGEP